MIRIFYIALVFALLSTNSCTRNCPEDVKIGEIKLTEESLNFFPYETNPVLVFKDETGEELQFTSQGSVLEVNRIAIYKTCTEFKYDGQSTYEYFEGEFKGIVFFDTNNQFSLDLRIFNNTLRPETELFYDKLQVAVTRTGTIGRGEIITAVHYNESHDEAEFNIDSPLEFLSEKVLNTVTYTHVYASEVFDGRQIFYTKEQGVVGFTFNGHTYNLDRWE